MYILENIKTIIPQNEIILKSCEINDERQQCDQTGHIVLEILRSFHCQPQ